MLLRNSNLETICRKWTNVPSRDSAYNPEVESVIGNVKQEYDKYVKSRDVSVYKELTQLIDNLGKFEDSGFFSLFRKEDSYEKIKELGDKLIQKKSELLKVKESILDLYNREISFVYTLTGAIKKIENTKILYGLNIEALAKEIEVSHNERQDDSFENYLNSIIDSKADNESMQLSGVERHVLKEEIRKKIDDSFATKCSEYLKLINDVEVIENTLTSYSLISEGREGPLNVIGEYTRKIAKQIASIENVLNFYQLYSVEQMNFLIDKGNIPEKFIREVNKLSESIEKIDRDACKLALESFFSSKKIYVKVPTIDIVVGDLIKEIEKVESSADTSVADAEKA